MDRFIFQKNHNELRKGSIVVFLLPRAIGDFVVFVGHRKLINYEINTLWRTG